MITENITVTNITSVSDLQSVAYLHDSRTDRIVTLSERATLGKCYQSSCIFKVKEDPNRLKLRLQKNLCPALEQQLKNILPCCFSESMRNPESMKNHLPFSAWRLKKLVPGAVAAVVTVSWDGWWPSPGLKGLCMHEVA